MAPSATVTLSEPKSNASVGALGRTKDGRPLKIRSYPKFISLEEERLYRKQHLAAAYRVFADRGYDEGVAGHISVRDPILTDHFWLNPLSMHFSQISVSDLILVNEEGEVVIGDEPINAAAFAIHSEIHKARPDVHAACHAHSVYGKAFSVFGRELDMITQDSLRFYKDHAVYPQFGGVVLDREEGRRIAEHLGGGKAIILQNHGLLTVGETVDAAAFWFVSLDKVSTSGAHGGSIADVSEFCRLAMLSCLLMLRLKAVGIRRLSSMMRRLEIAMIRLASRRRAGLRFSRIMMIFWRRLMVASSNRSCRKHLDGARRAVLFLLAEDLATQLRPRMLKLKPLLRQQGEACGGDPRFCLSPLPA